MGKQNAESFFKDIISDLSSLPKVSMKLSEMFEEDAKVFSKNNAVE
jgi:hypothetical protein